MNLRGQWREALLEQERLRERLRRKEAVLNLLLEYIARRTRIPMQDVVIDFAAFTTATARASETEAKP